MTLVHESIQQDKGAKMIARDVSVYYGAKKAIDEVSIDISPDRTQGAAICPMGHLRSVKQGTTSRWGSVPDIRIRLR